jgi:DNA-binding transcriptional LysR family regulator
MSVALATERNSAMNRSDLADLNAFVVVANHLSFRAASAQLGVTASALSHSMRQLEERHGVRLLHRTTRSVSLTDAGLRLLEQLRPAIDQISGALENLDQQRQRPFGRLRIHATHIAAAAAIAPVWARFASTYPDVHLEILVESRPIDIVAGSFDTGLGQKVWAAADMIAVRVMGPMKVAVVGAPSYFERRRPPRTFDDLVAHSCIQYRFAPNEAVLPWSFERNGKTKRMTLAGAVTVNDPLPFAQPSMGSELPIRSRPWLSRFCRQVNWCACWRDAHPAWKASFSIIPDTGKFRPRCGPSLT